MIFAWPGHPAQIGPPSGGARHRPRTSPPLAHRLRSARVSAHPEVIRRAASARADTGPQASTSCAGRRSAASATR